MPRQSKLITSPTMPTQTFHKGSFSPLTTKKLMIPKKLSKSASKMPFKKSRVVFILSIFAIIT